MRCEEFGPDLSAYADGELEPPGAGRVEAHLASCERCRGTLAAWQETGRRLRAQDATPDRAPAFRAAMRKARSTLPPHPAPRRRWFVSAAAAALLLAAVFSFGRARAEREVRELVELEGGNRAETTAQMGGLEALRLEIAAVAVRAHAAGFEGDRLEALEAETKALIEETERLRQRISEIQRSLEREGLLRDPEEIGGNKEPLHESNRR